MRVGAKLRRNPILVLPPSIPVLGDWGLFIRLVSHVEIGSMLGSSECLIYFCLLDHVG